MNKPNSILQNLTIAIVVPFFLFFVLELACRGFRTTQIIGNNSTGLTLEMPTWLLADKNGAFRITRIAASKKTLTWMNQFEEGLGFRVRLKPNITSHFTNTFSKVRYELNHPFLVSSNSLGFRGMDLSDETDPDKIRIVIFGDSSSFGWGVDQEHIYSSLLMENLQAKFPESSFEIGNFAIPGDSSEYGKLIFDAYIERFPADIVIFGFGANDAKASYIAHRDQVEHFSRQGTLHALNYWLNKSELFKTMGLLIKSRHAQNPTQRKNIKKMAAVPRGDFRHNLQYMGKRAEKLGARKVVLLGLCAPGDYLKSMRSLARKKNFVFFNAQKYLQQLIPDIIANQIYPEMVVEMRGNYPNQLHANKLLYISSDGCHPNKIGHHLIADELTKLISKTLSDKEI